LPEDDDDLQYFKNTSPEQRLGVLRSEGFRHLSMIRTSAFVLQYCIDDLNIADVDAVSEISGMLRQVEEAAEQSLKFLAELTNSEQ
jgi:hypothetical protein